MKYKLALATILVAFSATSVYASESNSPDILSSVASESIQAISPADASKVRGEYRTTTYVFDGRGGVISRTHSWEWSRRQRLSRQQLGPHKVIFRDLKFKFNWFGPVYVSR